MNNEIIRLFLEHSGEEFTGLAISKLLKKDFRTTYKYLHLLVSEGILSRKTLGKAYIYTFNKINHPFIIETELSRTTDAFKDSDIWSIWNRLQIVNTPLFICVLFGSRADKTQTKQSDYDVCIIADTLIAEKVTTTLSTLPHKLHILSFTPDDFSGMLRENSFNVGHEIVKKHIILHGAESFYWIVQHATK